jgi:hypothetical protein
MAYPIDALTGLLARRIVASEMKRRMRVLVLRLRRAFRAHYMLTVSAVAVGIAAAGALGQFDDDELRRPAPAVRLEPTATPAASPGIAPGAQPFLTVTYVFVSTEEERAVWDNVEETINQRELLSRLAIEVFVVKTSEQEAAAYEIIEAAKERYPWNEYVIEDLRTE